MRQDIWQRRADMVRELAEQGKTVAEIADELSWCDATVRRYGKQFNISMKDTWRRPGRPRRVKDKERNRNIVQRHLDGESLQDIGDCYGISQERVRQIVETSGAVSKRTQQQERALIVAGTAIRKNASLDDLDAIFPDIPRYLIRKYCKKHGVTLERMSQHERDEFERMANLVRRGVSIRKAAGCDRALGEKLRRYCQANGIKSKANTRWTDMNHRHRICREMVGRPVGDIAAAVSKAEGKPASYKNVYQWMQRHGYLNAALMEAAE